MFKISVISVFSHFISSQKAWSQIWRKIFSYPVWYENLLGSFDRRFHEFWNLPSQHKNTARKELMKQSVYLHVTYLSSSSCLCWEIYWLRKEKWQIVWGVIHQNCIVYKKMFRWFSLPLGDTWSELSLPHNLCRNLTSDSLYSLQRSAFCPQPSSWSYTVSTTTAGYHILIKHKKNYSSWGAGSLWSTEG